MLAKKTFLGGIHPPQLKATADKPIIALPLPDRVILHLSQHIGAPADSLFKITDTVNCGEKIAKAGGFVSAPVHASISGKIIGVGNFLHPTKIPSKAIVIERDKEAEHTEYHYENGLELPVEEIKRRIQESGVVGLGGATFPTYVKLCPKDLSKIDTVILNGAECEPALTTDYRMMIEHPEEIVNGLRIIMKVLEVKRGLIAIEDNKPKAMAAIEKVINELPKHEEFIAVQPLQTKYPQGGEKQIISACLNREVPSGKLPLDVGVVVANVTSAAYISYGVNYQMPLIERVVTLGGDCIKNPGNYLVRLGTTVADIVKMSGGLKEDLPLKKVIMGGPMMGFALYDLHVPIVKGTGGILFWSEKEAKLREPGSCIHCGRCESVCPMGLEPWLLNKLADHHDWEGAEKESAMDCMECGSCVYSCPASLPIVQNIKTAKSFIVAKRKKDRK